MGNGPASVFGSSPHDFGFGEYPCCKRDFLLDPFFGPLCHSQIVFLLVSFGFPLSKKDSLSTNQTWFPPKQQPWVPPPTKRKNREEPKRLPRKEARPWFPQKATHPCESEPPSSIGTASSRPMRPAASPGAPQMRRSPFWTVFAWDVAVWRCGVFFCWGEFPFGWF